METYLRGEPKEDGLDDADCVVEPRRLCSEEKAGLRSQLSACIGLPRVATPPISSGREEALT